MDLWGAITGVVNSDVAQHALTAGSDAAISRFIGSSSAGDMAIREAEPQKAAAKVETVQKATAPAKNLPGWVLPVGVGVGVLVVGGLFAVANKGGK